MFVPDNELDPFEKLEPLLKITAIVDFGETSRRFMENGPQSGNSNTARSTRLNHFQCMNWGFPERQQILARMPERWKER